MYYTYYYYASNYFEVIFLCSFLGFISIVFHCSSFGLWLKWLHSKTICQVSIEFSSFILWFYDDATKVLLESYKYDATERTRKKSFNSMKWFVSSPFLTSDTIKSNKYCSHFNRNITKSQLYNRNHIKLDFSLYFSLMNKNAWANERNVKFHLEIVIYAFWLFTWQRKNTTK